MPSNATSKIERQQWQAATRQTQLAVLRSAWLEMHRFGPLVFRDPAVASCIKVSLASLTHAERIAETQSNVKPGTLRPTGLACALSFALRFPPNGGVALDPVTALEDEFFGLEGPVVAALPDFLMDPARTGRKRLAPSCLSQLLNPQARTWLQFSRQVALLIEQAAWGLVEASDSRTSTANVSDETANNEQSRKDDNDLIEVKKSSAPKRRKRRAAAKLRKADIEKESRIMSDEDEHVDSCGALPNDIEAKKNAISIVNLLEHDLETRCHMASLKMAKELPAWPGGLAQEKAFAKSFREQRQENFQWRVWATNLKRHPNLDRLVRLGEQGTIPETSVQLPPNLLRWMQKSDGRETLWMRETRWEVRCTRAARRLAEQDSIGSDTNHAEDEEADHVGSALPFAERWRADMVWRRWQKSRSRAEWWPAQSSWPWVPRTPSPVCMSYNDRNTEALELHDFTLPPAALGPPGLPEPNTLHAPVAVPVEPFVMLAVPVSRLEAVASALSRPT